MIELGKTKYRLTLKLINDISVSPVDDYVQHFFPGSLLFLEWSEKKRRNPGNEVEECIPSDRKINTPGNINANILSRVIFCER